MLMHASSKGVPMKASDRRAAFEIGLTGEMSVPRYKAEYFEHAFSAGYDAAYYSYLWTESKAKCLDKFVRTMGGLSEVAGSLVRNELLAPGGCVSPTAVRGKRAN
jgi:peptidyl-dipeptidase Dcp